MSYIGRSPTPGEVIILNSIESQFNGALTTFNMTRTTGGVTSDFYPVSSGHLLVSLGGVIQKPDSTGNTGFRINYNTIIFAVAPLVNTSCFIISYGNILDIGTPADLTVTPIKLSTGGPSWDTSGNLTVAGNLTVNGSTTTINSTTLTIDDKNIVIADGANTLSGIDTAGIDFGSTNVRLRYNYNGGTNSGLSIEGTNVGIGITNPSHKLHVIGSVVFDKTNNGFSGFKVSDDSAGDYNVYFDLGRDQGNSKFWFRRGGRVQGTSPWTDSATTPDTIAYLSKSVNYFVGNVGIGISSPTQLLDVVGNSNGNTGQRIRNDSTGAIAQSVLTISAAGRDVTHAVNYTGQYVVESGSNITTKYTDYDTQIWRNNAGTERLRITSAGLVGIGTSSPSNDLDVLKTAAGSTTTARIGATATTGANNATLILNNGGTGNATLRFDYESFTNRASIGVLASDQKLTFGTAGSTAMTIDASQRVGIGITNPTTKLDVNGNSRIGGAASRSTSGLTVGFTNNTTFAANTDVEDTYRMLSIINESTTTNAMSVLGFRVNPASNTVNAMLDLKFVNTGATNTSALHYTFNHGGTFVDRFSILSSGNVGIGTTNPTAKLDVNGTIKINDGGADGNTTAFGSYKRLLFDNSHNDTARGPNKITMYNNGNTWAGGFGIHGDTVSYYSGGTHRWYKVNSQTSFTETLTLLSSGNLGIGTNSPQAPFGGRALQLGNISDARSVFTLQSSTTGRNSIYFSDGTAGGDTFRGYIDYIHSDNVMAFGVETSEALRITSTGNVGIGTINPFAKLEVLGQIRSNNGVTNRNSYSTGNYWEAFQETTEVQVISGTLAGGDNWPNCGASPTKYPIMGQVTAGGGYRQWIHITVWGSHRGIPDNGYQEYSEWICTFGDFITFQKLSTVGNTYTSNRWQPYNYTNNTAGTYGVQLNNYYPYNIGFAVSPQCGAGFQYSYVCRWNHPYFIPSTTRNW